jgi:hypothetical protein
MKTSPKLSVYLLHGFSFEVIWNLELYPIPRIFLFGFLGLLKKAISKAWTIVTVRTGKQQEEKRKTGKKKKQGETSESPPELPPFLKYSPKLQKLSIYLPNFQLLSIWTPPSILAVKIFKKDQNIHDFHFFF